MRRSIVPGIHGVSSALVFLVSLLFFLGIQLGSTPVSRVAAAEAGEVPEPKRGLGFTAFPEDATTITILRGEETYLDLRFVGWGPNWAWMGLEGRTVGEGGAALSKVEGKVSSSGARLSLSARARKDGPRRLHLDIELCTSKDTALTTFILAIEPSAAAFAKGRAVVAGPGGKTREIPFPLEKKGLGEGLGTFQLVDAGGARTGVSLEPACSVPTDGAVRIQLAGDSLRVDAPVKLSVAVELPEDLVWYESRDRIPAEASTDDGYEFRPGTDWSRPSEIGLEDWLDAPAGRQGRLVRKGDALLAGGKPIKLWGTNLCYGACAPERDLADRRASFYPRFGINAVRLHKFVDGPGWSGIQSAESCVEFDPAALDRMDYQVAKLGERGIYLLLSAHFGALRLGAGDRARVPFLEEFGKLEGREGRVSTPHSAIHYSRALQEVHTRQMVALLEHVNPYTKRAYAKDPAVAFVEIINEQSIFFYTSMEPLKASPTIRKEAAERFSDWLRAKYGSHEKLVEAWGEGAFDGFAGDGFPAVGERLDKLNILPLGNPWYWDPVQLRGSQSFRRRRLLDTLLFLYEVQNDFYRRFTKAVRAAGYEGELVASNWQAGRAYSHYYNLHSDALVGTIDRHNYFGGGDGGRIDNDTMLRVPGSGILGTGLQQVAGLPFMLSEWIHVTPNEWGVEGPAIIGAYGMGLQGWDVSFLFENGDDAAFSERIGRDRWDVMAPNVLGIFPAVARQVLRGDVRESEVLAPRYVHVPSLDREKLGSEERVTQKGDIKAFEDDAVPAAALAAARCVVEFTESYRDTPRFDLSRFEREGWLASTTGELRWRSGRSKLDGSITIDTPATKAVVGFAQGLRAELGRVTIESRSRFAAIYVTAKEKDRDIETSKMLLVVAVARARNTGMKVLHDERILDKGKAPVRMEPVKARLTIQKAGSPRVIVLDAAGRRTDRTLEVEDGTFEIDGARDKTCYYLVSYGE